MAHSRSLTVPTLSELLLQDIIKYTPEDLLIIITVPCGLLWANVEIIGDEVQAPHHMNSNFLVNPL
jgi:hypothetical protein